MRRLIPLAVTLKEASGSYAAALGWTQVIQQAGLEAFTQLGLRGDAVLLLEAKARDAGIFGADASVDRVRIAELVVLLDALDALPPSNPPQATAQPLVFTVPPVAENLVTTAQRLDLLVNDVIARAESSLCIGGPFWNDGGWDLLRPVVLPALELRKVHATFYLHPSESGHSDVLNRMLTEARSHGSVRALWWAGGYPSLMHAKFIVADGARGYFGTANLTSLGLGKHLEMGVALSPSQAGSLMALLGALESASLFADASDDH